MPRAQKEKSTRRYTWESKSLSSVEMLFTISEYINTFGQQIGIIVNANKIQ